MYTDRDFAVPKAYAALVYGRGGAYSNPEVAEEAAAYTVAVGLSAFGGPALKNAGQEGKELLKRELPAALRTIKNAFARGAERVAKAFERVKLAGEEQATIVTKITADGEVAEKVLVEAAERIPTKLDATAELAKQFDGQVPWAATAKNPEGAFNASVHWLKHGKEFPEIASARNYVEKAYGFVKEPPVGTLPRTCRNGDTVLYHPDSNTLVIHTPEKLPTTMYKPNPARHGYASNLEFFWNQNF